MADISRVQRLKKGKLRYAGRVFPGFNKPVKSDRGTKKIMVLARKGDRVKLVHAGHKSYKHNYSPKAKKNYLTRSAGIRNKQGQLTKDDKFSPNHWARRALWPRNKPTTSEKRSRTRRANMSRSRVVEFQYQVWRDRVIRGSVRDR